MLETIQVQIQHTELDILVSTGGLYGLAQPVLQQDAIGQAGQRIMVGQMDQFRLGRFDLLVHAVRIKRCNDQVRVGLLQLVDMVCGGRACCVLFNV